MSRFRQSTLLAVAVTGLALLLWGADTGQGQTPADTSAAAETTFVADTVSPDSAEHVAAAVDEATSTLRELGRGAYRLAPKIGIAIALLIAAAFVTRAVRMLLRRASRSWQRAQAVAALVSVVLWLLAVGAALAILAGDARALLGSVGLVGLALSWALQAPIESFTGWLLNSFRSYYRVGDRIAVGDVFGDVYSIDVLTTTVWEAGGEHKAVQGAQPTGALITFPNSEVLRANIINYTRDFPYVWDEIVVGISNESDLPLAMEVVRDVAENTVGREMAVPAAAYAELLRHARLAHEVSDGPQLYVSPTDAWMNITVRYLVPARQRRKAASDLHQAIAERLAEQPYRDRIKPSYPRLDVAVLEPSTQPANGEER
ncbi:MAG TPA: mechanosensitive ion channel domain-containing protein [Gemmatimonadaceae bacterium]|nr:mechanosensitive ion channel domain-containing protein [Gemmatimonadaceae bacterium]